MRKISAVKKMRPNPELIRRKMLSKMLTDFRGAKTDYAQAQTLLTKSTQLLKVKKAGVGLLENALENARHNSLFFSASTTKKGTGNLVRIVRAEKAKAELKNAKTNLSKARAELKKAQRTFEKATKCEKDANTIMYETGSALQNMVKK